MLFLDTLDDLHPFECRGTGVCIHCDRVETDTHDPDTCELCHDGEPTDVQTYGAGVK